MEHNQRLSVTLYVRADSATPERSRAVIERLRGFEARDRIAEYSVHEWPSGVNIGLDSETDGAGIHGTFRTFEEWAHERGMGIRPPFDVRESHSTITGETDERLVLPVLCLAVYDAEQLVGVFPCSDGEGVHTVEDGLSAIEAGEVPLAGSDDGLAGPEPVDARLGAGGPAEPRPGGPR